MDLEARKIAFLDKFMNLQNSDIVSQFENLLLNLKSANVFLLQAPTAHH